MLLQKIQNSETGSFIVDVPSQGLIIKGIDRSAKIKIDLVTSNSNDVNRLPEMSIETAVNISLAIAKRSAVISENADVYSEALILFSAGGVLPFDDDTKYKVTLTDLGATSDVEFHNLDSSALGLPVVVKKAEVRSTQTEKTENYKEVDLLVFDDVLPLRLTHLVDDSRGSAREPKFRKVEISPEQINAYSKSFRAVIDKAGTITYGLTVDVFPISQLNALTFHHDTSLDEDLIYYTVNVD
ncbi:MAG: hypothetical protein RH981_18975 [Arenibacter sp.]